MSIYRKIIAVFVFIAIFFSLFSVSALAGSFDKGFGGQRSDFYEFANFPGGGGSFGFGASRGDYDSYVSTLDSSTVSFFDTNFRPVFRWDRYESGVLKAPFIDEFNITSYQAGNPFSVTLQLFSVPSRLWAPLIYSDVFKVSTSGVYSLDYSFCSKPLGVSSSSLLSVEVLLNGSWTELSPVSSSNGSLVDTTVDGISCSVSSGIRTYSLDSSLSYRLLYKFNCVYSSAYSSYLGVNIPYFVSAVFVPPSNVTVSTPVPSTRPVSLMQTINNYNTDNSYTDNSETVNYYIGTLDAGGDVINIYNVNLYDEETLIFTEPVTGTQYQTTGWIYDYTTRCYTLSLASGTFTLDGSDIDTIELTYGDDALTIDYYSDSSLVESDEYAYVRVAQSECALNGHTYTYETAKEPTCISPGKRKYTCSVCGNQYAEEIPKTDHSYTVSVEQEATCTTNGIELYTCSICGDQHTQAIPALGHDWLATEVTDTTYNLPPGTSCPDCGGTDFTHELDKNGGVYGCTCSECGAEWVVSAEVTYGHTEYTCSRCGETYIESDDPESGLFASIGNFIANGIGWVTDKLSDLINSISGINDIFSGFVESIKEKAGNYPAFLGAAIACLPEDLTTVFWFAVVAAVVLAVWKKWFH